MKVWQKQNKEDLGKTLFSWRHRATSRFFTKIFTWLLGGFVSGILTSIVFLIIGLPAYSAMSARIVFFVVFILGVISAFFRNVYYGLEYRITEKALVHINPLIGLEGKSTGPEVQKLNHRAEYIPWDVVKEVADQGGALLLTIKARKEPIAIIDGTITGTRTSHVALTINEREEPLAIGVAPVASFYPATKEEVAGFPKLFSNDDKLDKEVLKKVVQKAREAKKAIQQ